MPNIRVLPEGLRNKIAAGQVVERPASVVKELVENSIDAGSASIEIEVLYGGKRLIRIADDGEGMGREDALLSLERHSTSKLGTEDDLFNIRTMGFRGEALASIAAVSKFSLATSLREDSTGVCVEAEGGLVGSVRDAPAGRGTTVEVRDLFFNTPARRKFLKREGVELMHIIEGVTALALSHPGIRFTMKADGEEALNLPRATGPGARASGLRERLIQVYGAEFMEGLDEVNKEAGGLSLCLFVSKPENMRSTRAHQLIFVNRRPVRDPYIAHAVYSAYEGIAPRESHPIFFLFMEVDPARVDFNVHPTKREVRFEDKEAIYGFLKRSVMEAIRVKSGENLAQGAENPASSVYAAQDIALNAQILESLPLQYRADFPFIYIGETFVAVSRGGGLTVIDYHAAHERVLYEKFLKGVELKSTQLLFPRQIKLSAREYRALLAESRLLLEFGIEVEDFGGDTVIVRTLPDALLESDVRGVLADAAGELMEGARPDRSLREAVAARIACHSSIRGSMVLSREGVAFLLEELDKAENPDQCPHGRPTRVFYSLDDLKKIFKRK